MEDREEEFRKADNVDGKPIGKLPILLIYTTRLCHIPIYALTFQIMSSCFTISERVQNSEKAAFKET